MRLLLASAELVPFAASSFTVIVLHCVYYSGNAVCSEYESARERYGLHAYWTYKRTCVLADNRYFSLRC